MKPELNRIRNELLQGIGFGNIPHDVQSDVLRPRPSITPTFKDDQIFEGKLSLGEESFVEGKEEEEKKEEHYFGHQETFGAAHIINHRLDEGFSAISSGTGEG